MSLLERWALPLAPLAVTAVLLVVSNLAWWAQTDAVSWAWLLPVVAALVAGVFSGWRSLAGVAVLLVVLVAGGVAAGLAAIAQPGYEGDGLELVGVVLAMMLAAACALAALTGMAISACVRHLARRGPKTTGVA